MGQQRLKKAAMSVALAFTLLLGSGVVLETSARAQFGARREHRREEVEKGYRDGLDRGQEDARDHRRYDPNNSEHYRHGNGAYREGFRRGYARGYGHRRR